MAIKSISKSTWPELKKFLNRDGYRFLTEYIEQAWVKEDQLHEMIYKLTAELKELKDEIYWLKTNQKK